MILIGDCLEKLKELPDCSVHCVVTSPPYWGLRDYGTAKWEGGDAECDHKVGRFECATPVSEKQRSNNGSAGHQARESCPKCGATRIDSQLGLEKTPDEYVSRMVEVFREVRRVLRDDGTVWLNLGDSYAAHPGQRKTTDKVGEKQKTNVGSNSAPSRHADGIKPKDLVGIPWRVAFALQADGWWLRQDIIWHKPNPMPESVRDRCTKSHEYIFMLSKSPRYYYDADAVAEPSVDPIGSAARYKSTFGGKKNEELLATGQQHTRPIGMREFKGTRNRRSVWTVTTKPYKGAHFATFPPKLIEPCILAGTSEKGCCPKCLSPLKRVVKRLRRPTRPAKESKIEGFTKENFGNRDPERHVTSTTTEGWEKTCKCENENTIPCTVLDPFAGSGTALALAKKLGRSYIGIELNPDYLPLIERRLEEN